MYKQVLLGAEEGQERDAAGCISILKASEGREGSRPYLGRVWE